MAEKRTLILNSLLTLILLATIYQFSKNDRLTREVTSIDRNMQRAQKQISELNEAASASLEQTMRRFDDFGKQLNRIAPPAKNVDKKAASAVASSTPPGAANPAKARAAAPAIARRNSAIRPAQEICDLPCYGRMLLPLLSKMMESIGYKVIKDPASASPIGPLTLPTTQIPADARRDQEAKLNRDLLEFLQMRAGLCDVGAPGGATDDAIKRCNENTRQLAEQGNAAAQKWLGTEARDKHDLPTAASWLELAANQGDIEAMDGLGSIYAGANQQTDQNGSDALTDATKTLYWYGKAAGLGDANAMGAIAGIYHEGRLTAQNEREAILWYELAAKAAASMSKDRTASANFAASLGDIYSNGTGVEPDKVQAYEWYAIACADIARLNTPADKSCESRNGLASELGPLDVAKGQALAAEWERLHRYPVLGSR